MTRGNQREIDRQRAANRAAKYAGNTREDGLTPQQRNERDAKAMAEKKAAKAAAKADGAKPTATGPVAPKKKEVKKSDDVSSLLTEGLKKKK
eukprot:CAMPEP_0118916656 /NCGR_PEP_ID=MMETSP1166-20130328/16612_1 /TAXON_ID=1104430 /ORGANISM="Chrysoreinhardia sp, Strain CCMP3193" /LENGTH=91 /DNA_ID=CAMNT_0006856557 /DNA_START=70 /DNA_END=345 /DNA_ORIENTATION=+